MFLKYYYYSLTVKVCVTADIFLVEKKLSKFSDCDDLTEHGAPS